MDKIRLARRLGPVGLTLALMGLAGAVSAVQLGQESFEGAPGSGYTVQADSGFSGSGSDYFVRTTVASAPSGLFTDVSSGIDGLYFIAAEDTDDALVGDADGIVGVTIDPISVSGYTNLEVTLAFNALSAGNYDHGPQLNGDYFRIYASLDGGPEQLVGAFESSDASSNNLLGLDTNLDGIGDTPLTFDAGLLDYTFAVPGVGDNLVVRIELRADAGNEEFVFDNVRVSGSLPDDPDISGASSLDLGVTDTATPVSAVYMVTNTGASAALDITGVVFGGPDAGSFSVTTSPLPTGIAAGGGTAGLVVEFTPTAGVEGPYAAEMTVSSTDGGGDDLVVDLAAFAIDPSVVINEFLADPADGPAPSGDANGDGVRSATDDEFVELYNASGGDLDITGWTVSDAAVSPRHVFPAGTIVPDAGTIIVFGGGTPTGTFGGSLVQTASTGGLGLNNTNDSIIIEDDLGLERARVDYTTGVSDESWVLDPEFTGTSYVAHSSVAGSVGAFSPGTQADGSQIPGNPVPLDDPDISVPASATAGTIAADASTTFSVLVSNVGTAQGLDVLGAALSGPGAAAYTVLTTPLPTGIAPGGGAAELVLEFTPGGIVGSFPADLEITSNDPTDGSGVVVALSGESLAPLPIYEEFDYASGDLVGSGPWVQKGSDTAAPVQVTAGSLAYPPLDRVDTLDSRISTGHDGDFGVFRQSVAHPFAPVARGDYYLSFVLEVPGLPTGSGSSDLVWLRETSGAFNARGRLFMVPGSTPDTFRLSFGQFSFSSATVTDDLPGTTPLLVVMEYDFDETGDDVINLYIDPVVGQASPPVPDYTHNVIAAGEFEWLEANSIDEIVIQQRPFAGSYTADLDAVRLVSDWAAATPGTPVSLAADTAGFNGDFGETDAGTPTASSSFDVVIDGGLDSTFTVSAPTPFEVSTDDVNWTQEVTGTVSRRSLTAPVYVRYNPAMPSTVDSGDLVVRARGAVDVTVPLSGNASAASVDDWMLLNR